METLKDKLIEALSSTNRLLETRLKEQDEEIKKLKLLLDTKEHDIRLLKAGQPVYPFIGRPYFYEYPWPIGITYGTNSYTRCL